MLLGLFGVAISITLLVCVVDTGRHYLAKRRLTNAVDAAAYSAAVFAARQLNFMAYTNRAMIANHLAAGHMTAYVSWLRYANKQVQSTNKLVRFIPGIGAVSQNLAVLFQKNKEVTEDVLAKAYLAEISIINQAIYAAQIAARADTIVRSVPQVAESIAAQYEPDIKLNEPGDLKELPLFFAPALLKAIQTQYTALLDFTSSYRIENAPTLVSRHFKPGEGGCFNYVRNEGCTVDVTTMYSVAEQSLAASPSARWLSERKKTSTFTPIVKLRKRSDTLMETNLRNWKQADRQKLDVSLTRDIPLGSGKAETLSLFNGYAGIPGYVDLDTEIIEALKEGSEHAEMRFQFVAKMSGPEQNLTSGLLDVPAAKRIYAQSAAEVFYEPLHTSTGEVGRVELPNLFNPSWQARLARTGGV